MKQLTVAVFSLLLSASVFAGANIQFENVNLDAGNLRPNSRAKIVFKFKNSGDELLEIKKVNASCGCTVPKLSKRELAPGESGELVLWFYTTGYYGAVTKTAKILTNSELNPSLVVSFTAVIKAELMPDKTKIEFHDLVPGQMVEKEVTVKNEMKKPAKLDAGRVTYGSNYVEKTGFEWKVKNVNEGEVKINFRTKLKADANLVRPARLRVEFTTNSKLDPKLSFSIAISQLPPMVVTPSSFFLPELSAGARHVAEIHIDSNGGQELTVTQVRLSHLPFNYELKAVSKTSAVIWLNVNDSAQSGRLQGSLQIFTTVGSTGKMRIIPVKGQIR